jgi:hypothetical protein
MGAAAATAGLSWTLPDVIDAHVTLYEQIGRHR